MSTENARQAKRLQREITASHSHNKTKDPNGTFLVFPDTDDLLTWYTLIFNINDDNYRGGQYLFKMKLPKEWPAKAMDVKCLTPTGRFIVNTSLCIYGVTKYHNEANTVCSSMTAAAVGTLSIMTSDDVSARGIGLFKDSWDHIADKEAGLNLRQMYARDSKTYNRDNNYNIIQRTFVETNYLDPETWEPKMLQVKKKKSKSKSKSKSTTVNESKPSQEAETVIDIEEFSSSSSSPADEFNEIEQLYSKIISLSTDLNDRMEATSTSSSKDNHVDEISELQKKLKKYKKIKKKAKADNAEDALSRAVKKIRKIESQLAELESSSSSSSCSENPSESLQICANMLMIIYHLRQSANFVIEKSAGNVKQILSNYADNYANTDKITDAIDEISNMSRLGLELDEFLEGNASSHNTNKWYYESATLIQELASIESDVKSKGERKHVMKDFVKHVNTSYAELNGYDSESTE